MDAFFLLVSLFFILLGIIGCFLPVIPGPLTSWIGFLFFFQINGIDKNYSLITITGIIALCVFLIDLIFPIIGAKKFGGTKTGIIGASLGLIFGLVIFGPLGLIIGVFLGAFIGELTQNRKRKALIAALGTIIGIITGVLLKFSLSIIFLLIYAYNLFKFKDVLIQVI
ncbi:MAG: hypothetical protein CMC79_04010 [Flavobacteriaceae bacterium]|nr:hypothetical protein [Flavobacteriaceae bacterium]|tara:strand:+ start:989 stop:1492 length:504 start_codon:yes stop_codon:yes gene_type:complete